MAQLIHTFFPSVRMVGWELDPAVVQAGRDHMGLADLEATGALVSLSTGDISAGMPREVRRTHAEGRVTSANQQVYTADMTQWPAGDQGRGCLWPRHADRGRVCRHPCGPVQL